MSIPRLVEIEGKTHYLYKTMGLVDVLGRQYKTILNWVRDGILPFIIDSEGDRWFDWFTMYRLNKIAERYIPRDRPASKEKKIGEAVLLRQIIARDEMLRRGPYVKIEEDGRLEATQGDLETQLQVLAKNHEMMLCISKEVEEKEWLKKRNLLLT